jgi:hypothetical protein
MELDIESDEDDELSRPLVRDPVLFDVEANGRTEGDPVSRNYQDMPRAAHAARNRDTEDVWAEIR